MHQPPLLPPPNSMENISYVNMNKHGLNTSFRGWRTNKVFNKVNQSLD